MIGGMTPTKGALRVCRGVVLAATSTTLAVTAHGIGGGGVPDTGLTLLLSFGVSAAGIALAGKRYTLVGVVTLLGVAQLATHLVLSVEKTGMSGMDMTAINGPAMFGAHAITVLITSLLVVRADALLFALAEALRRQLPTLAILPPIAERSRRSRLVTMPCATLTAVLLSRVNARRGPPAVA